ncbi:MAG: hypothetical protein ABIJ97_06735 [Bacteroidota bacterium]
MKFFKVSSIKYIDVLTFLVIVISLIPVITNKYFLTGDGPCHVYNSKVLLDYLTGTNVDFYDMFYYLNKNFEPNWFSHFSLLILLKLFPAFLAEKILIIFYILLFSFSLKYLIKIINPSNAFIVLLGLPFIFQFTFQMGFYNYSFSFAFMFLSLGYWLKHQENLTINRALILSLLLIVLFFCHPVGYFLNILTVCMIICFGFFIDILKQKEQKAKIFKTYFNKSLHYLLLALPSIILMLSYLFRKGLATIPNPDSFDILITNFVNLTSLVLITPSESLFAMIYFWVFAAILLYALISKVRYRNISWTDALFLIFIITLYIYFDQPGGIAGAGVLSIRLQFIPFIMLILWLTTVKYHKYSIPVISGLAFSIASILVVLRLPGYSKASVAVSEIMELSPRMESRSTVLCLNYSYNGKTPTGECIVKKSWLFLHAIEYLGADKSVLMFNNYEANMKYFPVIWKLDPSPFYLIGTNEGQSNLPPSVDINGFTMSTGITVDYVVTWCLDDEFINHPYTVNVMNYIKNNYELIYTSTNKLAKLYKRIIFTTEGIPKRKEFWEAQIRDSADLLELIKEKAQTRNVSIDEMISIDAQYLAELEVENSRIQQNLIPKKANQILP